MFLLNFLLKSFLFPIDNTEIIKILLDHGAFVNAEDVDKNTALHLAGVAGNRYLFSMLFSQILSHIICNQYLFRQYYQYQIAHRKLLRKCICPKWRR